LRVPGLALLFALLISAGCHQARKESRALDPRQTESAISGLRAAYAAFNRGDIDAAVQLFDPNVEWVEPAEFPGGGSYHGVEGAKRYLTQSRAGAAEVNSEPERFIPSGDRIVVFVYARVLSKGSSTWQEIRLADGLHLPRRPGDRDACLRQSRGCSPVGWRWGILASHAVSTSGPTARKPLQGGER
jgi:ketosteroid isomerase-like protein